MIRWRTLQALLLVNLIAAAENTLPPSDAIVAIMNRYERTFTLLEIAGSTSLYLSHLPIKRNMVIELVAVNGYLPTLLPMVPPELHWCTSIMVPPRISYNTLNTLSRCEHFDIVIVHTAVFAHEEPTPKQISILTSLGDHVFIVTDSKHYKDSLTRQGLTCSSPSTDRSSLYASYREKKGLDLARFTQKKAPASKPRYYVHSTYQTKEFFKDALAHPLAWVHGINLVTFCMLYGVYPADQILRKELARYRRVGQEHNDLIIGNFILQGQRLFAIDSHDARRNADPYRLLNAALESFKRGNSRIANPQAWIDKYYGRFKK